MATTVNLNNSQFRQFVQFAEQQANPANSEAIARVSGDRDALAGRSISAAKTDRVHHWYNALGSRSAADAVENNDARALFRDAVFSMFGGRDKVPESVMAAMRMEDYDQGRPLTARRIIAVRDAILQAADKVDAGALDRPKAETMVDAAIKNFDAEMADNKLGMMKLGNNMREKAIALVMKHGKGLTETCQRILANYVVTSMLSENRDGEERLENKLPALADYLRNVRDFKPGSDYRLTALDEQMKEYLLSSIADAKGDAEGLSGAFKTYAGRAEFTINGQHFGKDKENAAAVTDKFKEAISNPRQRRVISAVMTRNLRDVIVDGLNLPGAKGSELILAAPKDDASFKTICPVGRAVPKFTLSVEGTKAKLACHVPGNMYFKFNNHFAKNGSANFFMGKVDNYVECEFDLSDPDTATLAGVHFGQTVEAPAPRKATEPNWAAL